MRPLIGSRPTRKAYLRMQRAAHPVRATSTFPLTCSSMSKAHGACQLCPPTLVVQGTLCNRDLMATLRTSNTETHWQCITARYVMRTNVQHAPVRDKLPRREHLPPGRASSLRQPAKLGLEGAFPKLLYLTNSVPSLCLLPGIVFPQRFRLSTGSGMPWPTPWASCAGL
jgi:hypothetical protein